MALAYAPCVVDAVVNGKAVHIEVITDYPFRDEVTIKVDLPERMVFPLHVRVPNWALPCRFRIWGVTMA